MKAIVTGANGFIGSSLCKKLTDNNIEVLAIDISFAERHIPESEHIKALELSIDKIAEIEAEIKTGEYELFYHLAWCGVNGPEKGKPLTQIRNVEYAVKCLETAKKIGCKKFLSAGTIAEEAVKSLPDLENVSAGMMYGVGKSSCRVFLEAYSKNIGIDFVWMQFSNIYGPNNKTGNLVSYTLGELFAGRNAAFGPASQPYDFILVDDLLEAVYRLGVNKNKKCFYYIGSGKPRLLKEYLIKIGEIFGSPQLIKIGERPDDGIKYDYSMFDTTDLVADIGSYVSADFEEGIRLTVECMKGME